MHRHRGKRRRHRLRHERGHHADGGAGLTAGKGVDKLVGGAGNDVINSRDGKQERVRCGKGKRDRVKADRTDKLVGCEKVKRR